MIADKTMAGRRLNVNATPVGQDSAQIETRQLKESLRVLIIRVDKCPLRLKLALQGSNLKHRKASTLTLTRTYKDGEDTSTATISESFKENIGKHLKKDKKKLILHPEVADRWQEWLVTGLPKEERDELLKDYPRRGKCNLEAPKLNPEIESFIGVNTNDSRRDKGFAYTQEKVGVALSATGQAISSILDAEEAADKDLLFTRLWDAGKMLTEVHYKMSTTRRSYINPGMDKIIQNALKKTKTGAPWRPSLRWKNDRQNH
ncbi:hypothetical protein QAD02_019629 [Eretmocerus hayati]|uniref:Uncharacterized protein n=1 Tax=Eretmocerus hayati TaxID=131215 RepID=A0ACC2PK47_9HYME|nr:hypothetical protein QAD02_019629 [Eretmocerus hayati]